MYITGLLIGIFSFIIIGVFHPIVIRCEYHFTWKIWPVFLAAGLICLLFSLIVENTLFSSCSVSWVLPAYGASGN